MTEPTTVSPPDFTKLLKDNKHRTPEQARLAGAREFMREFNGGIIRGRSIHTERETLEIVVNSGLASDTETAKQIVNYMSRTEASIQYFDFFIWERAFKLQEMRTPSNDLAYKMLTFSTYILGMGDD